MKKLLSSAFACALLVGLVSGCSSDDTDPISTTTGPVKIDTLKVAFVPSREPAEIITATAPLKEMLIAELAKAGYALSDVEISVGTTYEAVGESLDAGSVDVGFIPGGTYVLYDEGAEVILASTRAGLSIDSPEAKVWNDEKPTTAVDTQVSFYRALVIAGPSAKGQELCNTVNSGTELTWDDLDAANWAVMSSTSSAGYIYPTLWLLDSYQKSVSDLTRSAQSDSYGTSFARLASGQVDLLTVYADGRRDYEDKWTAEYSRTASIWDETCIVGVTDKIFNDTVSVSKSSATLNNNPGFKEAIAQALINIGNTPEGKEVVKIYAHEGYAPATSADYDPARKAQKVIQEMQNA
ncbi:MAG: PhnD/SsuA/transferrin family substrate-binding protein [Propionibacteriaceae bacterium]|jgi:phosphonate transport system substrate-binding protein|nr:PhnD/SsuA/transferrin family substrate-binding protein [Propionibacteriaceae bacterium]